MEQWQNTPIPMIYIKLAEQKIKNKTLEIHGVESVYDKWLILKKSAFFFL